MKNKAKTKRKIAEFVLSEIEFQTQGSNSPVTGRQFKPLSKNYAKFKKGLGKGTDPDLHLTDSMINSLFASFKAEAIEFKITDSLEKKKAHNHNLGVTLPRRPFLPNDENQETFNASIRRGIERIIADDSQNQE